MYPIYLSKNLLFLFALFGFIAEQYNNSPKLTKEFIEFLEDVDIDIYQCIYKVFNTESELYEQ